MRFPGSDAALAGRRRTRMGGHGNADFGHGAGLGGFADFAFDDLARRRDMAAATPP
jgi:hypothetical protein